MQSQRRSPPKHRHDGTSPLPLGMDWSPPPRKWNGRGTVWPHDPHSGWSYCVTIPSWVVLPKSRDSDSVVFYRVQVGIQSPEGITACHGVLRRFNDFLKLFADLKKSFPKKSLPPAPPKGLLHLKSKVLLEERRCSLEEWMTKLLCNIDLSRTVAVASFLDLEAAARSSFQDVNEKFSEANTVGDGTTTSFQKSSRSNQSFVAGSSSVASDYGSDTAYETSEVGTSRLGRDDSSEIGLEDLVLDEDLTGSIEKFVKYGMSNIDEGLFMGQTILAQLEGFPRRKMDTKNTSKGVEKDVCNGNGPRNSSLADTEWGLFSESELGKVVGHARKPSTDSVGSYLSSVRGSEISILGIPNSSGGGSSHFTEGAEASTSMLVTNLEFQPSGEMVLPMDQGQKMNKVLLNMQQKLTTAKTDMEDLIGRLNQEMAVKDYLMTKVKDLEVELETTKQKSKENLQQAILSESERITKIQWEMEEIRQKTLETELKLHSNQDDKPITEPIGQSSAKEEDLVLLELNATKEQRSNLSKQYQEMEAKSKADIKVLVKEVKSLRNSQKELKQGLSQSLSEKFKAEERLQRERGFTERVRNFGEKLISECRDLHDQLIECNVNFLLDVNENQHMYSSLLEEASDLLATSDDKIKLLLEKVQMFGKNNGSATRNNDDRSYDENHEMMATYDELRMILADIFIDSTKLRKQVNSFIRCNLKTVGMCSNPEIKQRSSKGDNLE